MRIFFNYLFYLALLVLAWVGLTSGVSPANIAVGAVVGVIALWYIRFAFDFSQSRPLRLIRRPHLTVFILATFFWELFKASVHVALMSLSPRIKLAPGILAVPLSTRDTFEIAMFANLITLVPGTVSVDVSDDNETLYMHVLDASDPDAQRREVKQVFEARVIRTLA